jgi:hypothetical protein
VILIAPYPGNLDVVVESLKALVTYGPLISYLTHRDAQVVGLAGAVLWNVLSASGLAGASALSHRMRQHRFGMSLT